MKMEITDSTKRKGTSVEFLIISKLLKYNFDVYIPVADTSGIDIIVRSPKGKYVEIQVKSRIARGGGRVFDVKDFKPRDTYFICCYLIEEDEYWLIPSEKYYKHAAYNNNKRRLDTTKLRFFDEFKGENGLRKIVSVLKLT